MNMRAPLNPYNSFGDPQHTALIDKMFGNAYDTVRYVACNLKMLTYVAHNMEAINKVAQGMLTNRLVMGTSGQAGSTVQIPLPADVPATAVVSSSVLIATQTGDLYGPDSGFFTATIMAGKLNLTLKGAAPVALENASVRWFLQFMVA